MSARADSIRACDMTPKHFLERAVWQMTAPEYGGQWHDQPAEQCDMAFVRVGVDQRWRRRACQTPEAQ